MRGPFKGLFILLAVGLAFCIPLFILFGFFFHSRVERRVEYSDQAIVQHSTAVGGIQPMEQLDVSARADHPGQEYMARPLPAEMPESVQINGAGSVTVITPGQQPDWQPGQMVVQTPGVPPFHPTPTSIHSVRWISLSFLLLCLLGGMFVALLVRVARGAGRPERRGMDPEIDMLAVRIHEKEEQLMRRLEALETLLVGELGRESETRRG